MHKDQLPTNLGPDQAWWLGAVLGVDNNITCLREIIDKYPDLYLTNLKSQVDTPPHHQSNYFAALDNDNLADDMKLFPYQTKQVNDNRVNNRRVHR